ncbi:hypothetical protein [Mycolicibacterium goodii]|uniref:Diphosphate--fructose-6-phosphate 1-phosphotransferase n=1 Tax=Mycolicibacterium goodii TaxID=134601 RepID=A0A0K0XDS2_MYCGD|nr:diphosphate--fructose-6-phosphate 1-phosphotransferase [Mycolicibacterium goodii]
MRLSDPEVTYRYVRVSLVALAVFLLVSLGITWWQSCPQGSISAFFYTRTHTVFVAALAAMGVCLIAYKGSRIGEDALLNFSGFMAFVVALIPADAEGLCRPWLPTEADPFGAVANNITALFIATAAGAALYLGLQRGRREQPQPTASPGACAEAATPWKRVATALLSIERWLPAGLVVISFLGALLMLWPWFALRAHAFAASAMFLAITLVAVYHACYARAAVRPHRARFYATVAALMLATVVLAIVFLFTRVPYGVLTVEIILIVLFGIFWGVQTWDVWDFDDRYPAAAVPALASGPQAG